MSKYVKKAINLIGGLLGGSLNNNLIGSNINIYNKK